MTDSASKRDKVREMDEHMQMGVKSLIEAVPEVGRVLERYGIGCVPCAIGTCQLQEVVKIHFLPAEDEREMLSQIEIAINAEHALAE